MSSGHTISLSCGSDRLTAGAGAFQQDLLGSLIGDCYAFHDRNTDFWREGASLTRRTKRFLKDRILAFLRQRGFVRVLPDDITAASSKLSWVMAHAPSLDHVYALLADDHSRKILLDLMRYRILGSERVRLPLATEDYWSARDTLDEQYLTCLNTIQCGRFALNRYHLMGRHHALDLHCHPLGILNTFLLEQYAYRAGKRVVQVEPGETVIDAGGCWGDTTLYFSDRVGPRGKVFCFELLEENLGVLRQNLQLNEACAGQIDIVSRALWDRSGERLSLCGSGPGTSIAKVKAETKGVHVSTISLDDFVGEQGIERVDFIKMDIEGAEMMALQGAERTLRRWKPRLAISVYHNYDDIIRIPLYLENLGLGYEFFLDHFTIHSEETVLFATAAPSQASN